MSSSVTLDGSTQFYNEQNYTKCQGQLEQILCNESHVLTMRHKIILTNNILVCKLKLSITAKELEVIKREFLLLWQLLSGLPRSHDSHVTLEYSIICNLLSCIIRLWLLNGYDPLISEGIRLCSDITSRVGNGHTMRKFQLLSSLLNLINSNGKDTNFYNFMERDSNNISSIGYNEAYQLYKQGCYVECLSRLHPLYQPTPKNTVNGCIKLLLANCHAKVGRYQLSLHYYQTCLEISPLSHMIMINVSLIYQILQYTTAELTMRELAIKLMKNERKETYDMMLWRDGSEAGGVVRDMGNTNENWMMTCYEYIIRALDNGCYSDASHMTDILCNAIIDNQLLPHNFPPISTIYILATHAHLLSNDITKAETSVAMVTQHPIPLDINTPLNKVLIYIMGLWYMSLVAVAKENVKECGHMTVTCLHAVNYVLSHEVSEDMSNKILKLKQMLLNNLAIIAILEHGLDHAHQLLCNCVATNIGEPAFLVTYNYCLILVKMDKLKEACLYWLEEQGVVPTSEDQAKELMKQNQNNILTYTMLNYWLHHILS